MEAALASAMEDFTEFSERTSEKLRQAFSEEMKAQKERVVQQEEALRQREARLCEREQELERQVQEFERRQKQQLETSISSQGVANISATMTPTRSGAPALPFRTSTGTAGSPVATAVPNSLDGPSAAAAGTASLRAMFERPASRAGTPRQEERDVRWSCASERDRKERSASSSRISFRAQEGPLRRNNSGAGLTGHSKSSGRDQQELQPQWKMPLESPTVISKTAPAPSPRSLQSDASSPKKQRPPLSPTKKRQASPSPLMSPQPSPEREQLKQSEREVLQELPPAKPQPAQKRSLAELLKMDEERCASP